MYRILELNPQLQPFARDIELRMELYHNTKNRLLDSSGRTLKDFANAHHFFGIHHLNGKWVYREWAPSAYQLYFTGDFNGWNQTSHPMNRLENGIWEITLEGRRSVGGLQGQNRGGRQYAAYRAYPPVCPPGGTGPQDYRVVRGGRGQLEHI